MLRAMIRIVFGYVLACAAAGLTMVLHVVTPAALASLAGDSLADKLTELATLAGLSATHIAVFSLPFALIVAAIAEWFSLRGWLYFVLGGLAIAGTGFLAQQAGESTGGPSIVNPFAIQAFVLTGVLGGIVFWLVAGRHSGGDPGSDWETFSEPTAAEKPGRENELDTAVSSTPVKAGTETV